MSRIAVPVLLKGYRKWRAPRVAGPPSPSRPSGSTPPPLKGWRKGARRREFAPFLHPFRGGGVEGVARDGEGEFPRTGEGAFRSQRPIRLASVILAMAFAFAAEMN